ncbi:MAG: DUF1957 domain-containing protein [Verrucomicrobiales bacterium]|nr:DUF1957 domain-containing protein [Verrucomicrobiales bacterium]
MNRHCALVLHAHVPWVRHPETPRCLEEDWLFEAILEAYLPLLEVLHRLRDEEVPWKLTLNLSPTLLSMLRDPLMQERATAYLDRTAKLANGEVERGVDAGYRRIAQWYGQRLHHLQRLFEDEWDRDLVGAFKDLQDSGHLEITACGATHGLLPLLMKVPEAARAQIEAGVALYESCFGKKPRGFWLPECAFAPAVSKLLKNAGIQWTLVEEHGLTSAPHAPDEFPFVPGETADELAVFARDTESSRQVWSAESGYPGDPRYREFFRDVGLEAPAEALEEYLEGSDIRRFTGLKFHRVTGSTDEKLLYDPPLANRAADEHAIHFVSSRAAQLAALSSRGIEHPIVVSAFDAELFGHWWFEGPQFLEKVLRNTADRTDFEFTTPGAYLETGGAAQLRPVEPVSSSWGEGGYFETWLSEENAWIYPHLHKRADQLSRVVKVLKENIDSIPESNAEYRIRCVNQMARELMLAQSSDWAFLMRNGAARPYAKKRTEDHFEQFDRVWAIFSNSNESDQLTEIEESNPIFPDISWETFEPVI